MLAWTAEDQNSHNVVRLEYARDKLLRASEVDQPREGLEFKAMLRPKVQGKFLYVGDKHFWIRGVTYGTFRPDVSGLQFPSRQTVEHDFRAIADAGLNSVRVYTVPPRWLLDIAISCTNAPMRKFAATNMLCTI
jgi:hypothetical protein